MPEDCHKQHSALQGEGRMCRVLVPRKRGDSGGLLRCKPNIGEGELTVLGQGIWHSPGRYGLPAARMGLGSFIKSNDCAARKRTRANSKVGTKGWIKRLQKNICQWMWYAKPERT